MNKKLLFGILLALSCIGQQLNAQEKLEIGMPAPAFSLRVNDPNGKALGLSANKDYHGKWLVLDFWTRACIACIHAMPKLSNLEQHFEGRINFLLIGKNDQRYNSGIEAFYGKIAKSEKLRLHTAFDTASFTAYGVRATPQVVIISPNGMLYAITSSEELTAERLKDLVAGKQVNFEPHIFFRSKGTGSKPETASTSKYLGTRKVALNADGAGYESRLSIWKKGDPINLQLSLGKKVQSDSLVSSAMSLERLYLLAYFGIADWKQGDSLYLKVSKKASFPEADSLLFGKTKEKTRYNYLLKPTRAKDSNPDWMKIMQQDLTSRFGYLVSIEEQQSTVFGLRAISSQALSKLQSVRAKEIRGDATGYRFKGIGISELLARIGYYHPRILLSDQTAITGKIDIDLDCNMLDLESIRGALKANGLSLLQVETQIEVLTLRKP